MWLASISLRNKRGEIIGTSAWSERQFRQARKVAYDALQGIGDAERERHFRMNATFCIHRGVSAAELQALPQWWKDADAVDIAGGPLEVLFAKGVPDVLSAEPCRAPGKNAMFPGRPDLWIPVDCGACPPCMARKAVRTRGPLDSGVYRPEDLRPLARAT